MPYMITTYRHAWRNSHTCTCPRRAVATLEEAQVVAAQGVRRVRDEDGTRDFWNAVYPLIGQAETLPESGGKVGPLPDGTVIEVVRVEWRTLAEDAEIAWRLPALPTVEIIDAFNAREAVAT